MVQLATTSLAPLMPEAEVSLRVAPLFDSHPALCHVDVAIDGAHVRIAAHESDGRTVAERSIFDVVGFLAGKGWNGPANSWVGIYTLGHRTLSVRRSEGFDVRASLPDGSSLCVECRGGPLAPRKGRSARQILSGALGQALVCPTVPATAVLVAVPDTTAFETAAGRALPCDAFRRTRFRIALVGGDGVRVL
jgi:hypothetical protein